DACSSVMNSYKTQRDYTDLQVEFAHAWYRSGSSSCGQGNPHINVIHKYEISEEILTCPDGTVYNQQTGLCEAPVTCPTGSTYDETTQQCSYTAPLDGTCNPGFIYNGGNDKCEFDPNADGSCPDGTTYNSNTGKCEGEVQGDDDEDDDVQNIDADPYHNDL